MSLSLHLRVRQRTTVGILLLTVWPEQDLALFAVFYTQRATVSQGQKPRDLGSRPQSLRWGVDCSCVLGETVLLYGLIHQFLAVPGLWHALRQRRKSPSVHASNYTSKEI